MLVQSQSTSQCQASATPGGNEEKFAETARAAKATPPEATAQFPTGAGTMWQKANDLVLGAFYGAIAALQDGSTSQQHHQLPTGTPGNQQDDQQSQPYWHPARLAAVSIAAGQHVCNLQNSSIMLEALEESLQVNCAARRQHTAEAAPRTAAA